MAWNIELTRSAQRQLEKLEPPVASQVSDYLYNRVANMSIPRELGHALSGPLQGLGRFRIGDYRVIRQVRDAELVVLALGIGHRKEIYH